MQHDSHGFFWPSYVDLLTGLFVTGLVLFVLTYKTLSVEKEAFRINAEKYARLQEIERSVAALQDTDYFTYQPKYKRHVLRKQVQFAAMDATIAPQYHDFLRKAGYKLQGLITSLRKSQTDNTRYMIVIEGMASRDRYGLNYELSYSRALSLFRFWQNSGITFDNEVCEVIISGSGTGGVGRDSAREVLNQRFLIQIIPKVGQ